MNKKLRARDFRKLGAEQFRRYPGELIVIQLIFELFLFVLGLMGLIRLTNNIAIITIFSAIQALILLFISGPINFSFIYILEKVKGEKGVEIKDLLFGFSRFSQAFIVDLLKSIFLFLWSLLLIIPGIIKAYSHSMTDFIAFDDPNITSNEAITKSRAMMDGHKWRLFCLELSYIGWFILVGLTFGILGLWVMPKFNLAKYNFYLDLLNKQKVNEEANNNQ